MMINSVNWSTQLAQQAPPHSRLLITIVSGQVLTFGGICLKSSVTGALWL